MISRLAPKLCVAYDNIISGYLERGFIEEVTDGDNTCRHYIAYHLGLDHNANAHRLSLFM